MQVPDSRRFFKSLAEMALIFSDELSKERQKLYWALLCDQITIEEWEYACQQAMGRETFHKVPLPAQLMDYVQEYREARRDEAHRQRRMREEERRLLAESQARDARSDAEWLAAQERGWQEAQENLNRLFGTNWRAEADMQAELGRIERDTRLRQAMRREDGEGEDL